MWQTIAAIVRPRPPGGAASHASSERLSRRKCEIRLLVAKLAMSASTTSYGSGGAAPAPFPPFPGLPALPALACGAAAFAAGVFTALDLSGFFALISGFP